MPKLSLLDDAGLVFLNVFINDFSSGVKKNINYFLLVSKLCGSIDKFILMIPLVYQFLKTFVLVSVLLDYNVLGRPGWKLSDYN